MKFLVIFAATVACAAAASPVKDDSAYAPIVKSSYDQTPEGNFQYAYETGNGISAQASGGVKNPNAEYPALEVQGGYKYTSPEGVSVDTTYVANENGFQPQGSHLPVPPPIPEAIARALAYIESHPPSVEKTYNAVPYKAPSNVPSKALSAILG